MGRKGNTMRQLVIKEIIKLKKESECTWSQYTELDYMSDLELLHVLLTIHEQIVDDR
jgi:hypothetical protein